MFAPFYFILFLSLFSMPLHTKTDDTAITKTPSNDNKEYEDTLSIDTCYNDEEPNIIYDAFCNQNIQVLKKALQNNPKLIPTDILLSIRESEELFDNSRKNLFLYALNHLQSIFIFLMKITIH